MTAKKLDDIIKEMDDEELIYYADIPIEIAQKYLLELYHSWVVGKVHRNRTNKDYPGISQICYELGIGNRTVQDILNGTHGPVSIDCMDRICSHAPFSLYQVTEDTIEWANKNKKKNWPRNYINQPGRVRIRKNG